MTALGGLGRVAWRALVIALLLVVAYVGGTAVQVWLTSRTSDLRTAQAAVVMGAAQYNGVPSPVLTARLEDAEGLWMHHLVPIVVVTGYKETGDRYTEAQASGTWLVAHGMPVKGIVEVGGSDSWANLADAADVLRPRGIDDVLLVTDGFHEHRSLSIANDVGLRASPVPATRSPITGWSTVPYFAKEAMAVAFGRVVGYSHLHDLGESGVARPVG